MLDFALWRKEKTARKRKDLIAQADFTSRVSADRIRNAIAFNKLFYAVFFTLQRHADNRESFVFILVIDTDERGSFYNARPAPRRPKVHQDDFALIVGKLQRFTIDR